MNEINNSEVNFGRSVKKPAQQQDMKSENKRPEDIKKDYKEAVAAPGAEAAGRAQIMINKTANTDNIDNIDSDIDMLVKNPSVAYTSDALFMAAEKAGIPYPEAAVFATTEVME